MLLNYLIILSRNIVRSPAYFLINLLGLSIGILSCIVLTQYVVFESNFDNQYSDIENKYRIIVRDNDGISANTPVPVGMLVKQDFSQVMYSAVIREADGLLKLEGDKPITNYLENAISATPDFFKIFDIPLLNGTYEGLSNPNTIYISEALAMRYFNSIDIVGKELTLYEDNFGQFYLTIAGVMENHRGNTHLPFDVVFPMDALMNSNNPWASFDNWGWNEFYTYVQLQPNTSITQAESNAFIDKYIGEENRMGAGIEARYQPLEDIHLTSGILNEFTPTRDRRIIQFLFAIALFIIILASENYINLTTARGLKRAKEVGLRKNMGASRSSLIYQFSLESLLIFGASFILAVTMFQLIQPILIQGIGSAFETTIWNNGLIWQLLEAPLLITLIWSSLQPAFLISSYSMTKILKGDLSSFGKGRVYRKVSVIIQFSLSLIMMTLSYILYEQINLFQNQNLGIDIQQKLVIERPKETMENYKQRALTFKNELTKLSNINAVSLSGAIPSEGFNWSTNSMHRQDLGPNGPGEFGVNVTYIDNDYIDIYQPEVLAGSGTGRLSTDYQNVEVVINQKAMNPLKIDDVNEAIGLSLVNGDMNLKVVGVIDDYQHTSLKSDSRPAVFILQENANYFTIDFSSNDQVLENTQELISQTQELYQKSFPGTSFNYKFLDDQFAEAYHYESFLSGVVLFFTVLAIFLAALSLSGISLYDISQKTKEVGIRKSLGATSFSLFWTNFKPFSNIILISSLIAIPVSYFVGNRWLEAYIFKIELGALIFILPVFVLSLIILATVSYHILKLNNTNPVDSLRYE